MKEYREQKQGKVANNKKYQPNRVQSHKAAAEAILNILEFTVAYRLTVSVPATLICFMITWSPTPAFTAAVTPPRLIE